MSEAPISPALANTMNATDALRFLAHEAKLCRDRDAHEAFCLLLPALCKVVGVSPLDDVAALAFQQEFHNELRALTDSPLVEANCEICGFVETLPDARFSKGWKPVNGRAEETQLAKAWCAHCDAERYFLRGMVPAKRLAIERTP